MDSGSAIGGLFRFFFSSPLPLYAICVAGVIILHPILSSLWDRHARIAMGGMRIVALCAILWLGGLATIHLFSTAFVDFISPSIVTSSALFARGEALYHEPSASSIYSLLYGPAVHVVNGAFITLLGSNLFAAKLSGILALLATCLFLYYTCAPMIKKEHWGLLGGVTGILLLIFWAFSFEARVDALLLMCAAMALFGTTRKAILPASIIAGIAIGIGINIKITGVFYFIPLCILLYRSFGWRGIARTGVVATATAIAPFVFFSNISLHNYLLWLQSAGGHGLEVASFLNNIVFTLLLFIPLLAHMLYEKIPDRQRYVGDAFTGALFASMVATSLLGSKAGSGHNHLLPFVPLLLYGYAASLRAIDRLHPAELRRFSLFVIVPLAIALTGYALVNAARITRLYATFPRTAAQDIETILAHNPNLDIAMGASGSGSTLQLQTYLPTFRALLVLSGEPAIFDYPAAADLKQSGAKFSGGFMAKIETCAPAQAWLFPRGSDPFKNVLGYGKEMFDPATVEKFKASHHIIESTQFFDLWGCSESNAR